MKVPHIAFRFMVVAALIPVLLATACGGQHAATPTAEATIALAPAATATASPPPATATAIPPTPIPPTPTPLVTNPSTATPASTTAALSAAPSDPRAQAVIDKARVRFDGVNTLHFVLAIDGDVYLDKTRTQKLKSGEGDLVRPDKVSLTARAAVGPVNAQLKFIQIGDDTYLTNILSGKWEKAPTGIGYDPRLVFDRDRGVPALLTSTQGWSLVGTEKVNGADTQHVRAAVPAAQVSDLVSASLRGDTVDVDLFVEPKNNDVVRLIVAERPDAVTAGTVAARWTLDLSKQNDNIKIDPPALGT